MPDSYELGLFSATAKLGIAVFDSRGPPTGRRSGGLAAEAADWPQFRFDANRGAASPETLPAQLHLQWVREFAAPQPAFPGEVRLRYDATYEPVVMDGTMFVPSMVTDSVTALDAAGGEVRWRFFTGGPVRFAPVAKAGRVYFGSDDGHLYCVGAADGKLRWKYYGMPDDRRDRNLLGNRRLIPMWPQVVDPSPQRLQADQRSWSSASTACKDCSMRTLVAALFFIFFLTAIVQAAEPRRMESADQRWAADGSGGAPDFTRHVMPLFSTLGCNMRACHGSFQGQNGFRLSLFGFEPDADRNELLEIDEESEGDGPRIDLAKPDDSLLLYKPTSSEDEHGGGKRMEKESWQYRVFHEWISAGAHYDPKSSPKLIRLKTEPAEIVFGDSGEEAPIRAMAWFDDGTYEDVTALTVFSSNDEGIARVLPGGKVSVSRTGDTAIVAQYAGGVTSTQVLVPAADDGMKPALCLPHNEIDELVMAKLRKLNIQSSGLCSDGDFIRRVHLDAIGRLPTADETRAFLADRSPDKRKRLIDRLLDQPEYATYWAMKFSDWTGNGKYLSRYAMASNWMWQDWVEDKLTRNVPYDELVYGFVCATSLEGRTREEFLAEVEEIKHKTSGRYQFDDGTYAKRRTNDLYWTNVERRNPDTLVLQTANSFLGLRLECAQCHNHPFDRWTQKDFEQFKSFFMLARYCDPKTGEESPKGRGYGDEAVEPGVGKRYAGSVRKTPPKLLGGPEIPYVEGGGDQRVALWEWMRSRENPYFAPAFVNRIWHHYFGVGIVDPPDDFNQGNPPSNPQLLSWLATDFMDRKFDIKRVHRVILNSRTYQLSFKPNASNQLDKKNFSHAIARRMPAEVLIDAVADATGVPNNFGRVPRQRAVGQAMTAVRYGGSRPGYAMKIFGRPDREKTCDCERSNEPSVAQALYLINDQDVLAKLSDSSGKLPRLLKSMTDDRELITELYLTALSRFPSERELDVQLQYVEKAADRENGMKDVLWTLLNVREFVFNH